MKEYLYLPYKRTKNEQEQNARIAFGSRRAPAPNKPLAQALVRHPFGCLNSGTGPEAKRHSVMGKLWKTKQPKKDFLRLNLQRRSAPRLKSLTTKMFYSKTEGINNENRLLQDGSH